jgi:hypothetical protein
MDNPGERVRPRRKGRQQRDCPKVASYNCRNLIVLDWSDPIDWRDPVHWNRGRQAPCVHCGKPALLLDAAGRPAHKVCAEAALAAA